MDLQLGAILSCDDANLVGNQLINLFEDTTENTLEVIPIILAPLLKG